MNDTITRNNLAEVADQVASNLAKADMLDGRAFIRTPVLFPSGATVVVVIEEEGRGRYRLSDLGQGHDEAELLSAGPVYHRQAADVARSAGLALAGHAFVLTGLDAGQLVAGVMTVANAAARTLERTMLRADQRAPEDVVEKLATRLVTLFPRAQVSRAVELRGASTHPWRVDALVTTGQDRAVFEVVMPSPVSVAFAAAKFHDIARLEHAPARVAVVRRKAALGDLLAVVSQAARVIEEAAPDATFRRAVVTA